MATKGVCKDLRRPPNRKVQAVEGQGFSSHPSKPSSFYGAWEFLLPQREGGAMSPREAPAPDSSSTGQRREQLHASQSSPRAGLQDSMPGSWSHGVAVK